MKHLMDHRSLDSVTALIKFYFNGNPGQLCNLKQYYLVFFLTIDYTNLQNLRLYQIMKMRNRL